MRQLLNSIYLLSFFNLCAQEEIKEAQSPMIVIDSLYREDQFYFGFTFNNLNNKPSGLSQNKFSTGFSVGFLRDMPVNKKRTLALASGVGFTYNNFIQNLDIEQTGETITYALFASSEDYSKNRFSQLFVDVPIEFRWRTSTYESYKFWRIYSGVKFSYLIYDRYVSTDAKGTTVITNNKDFDKLQYGIYLATGYNTFNIYAYYGLNALFKSAKVNGEQIDMKAFNVGVIFYIL
ncbi:porin family protein [Flavobacterium ovatum]|uniref:porin family protein n=1 Tax=Flavobacterium ovatum TaxID=1928857 RepID=UPI00344C2740